MEIELNGDLNILNLKDGIPIGFIPKFEASLEIFEKLYNKDNYFILLIFLVYVLFILTTFYVKIYL